MRTATSHTTLLIAVILFVAKCKAQIVVILFVVFSSDVIISPYPLKMSPQYSAFHFTLPQTQACFPRPIVCLGGGVSLTASAYRGIKSPSRCHHSTLLFILHFPGRRPASPVQLFCLGDGISLRASAYRGIRSNANICFSFYTTPDTGLLPPSTTASAYRGV